MRTLAEIVKPFVFATESCEEVKTHFENTNQKPIGPYIELAKYFKGDEKANYNEYDEKYKEWLSEQIPKGEKSDSTIISCLSNRYTTEEELRDFVFLTNCERPEFNQKWHYFISYWGYREFATQLKGKKPLNITLIDNQDKVMDTCPFKKCVEGAMWYDYIKAKYGTDSD